MKVLQINQVVRVTSTGRIVESLGNYIMEQGHESYIAYSGRPKNESNSTLYQISNSIDTIMHALGTRLFDRHGLYSNKVTRDFVKWIVQVDPDIIHLHNIHGYYLNYPILFEFLEKFKKPVFWTFHDFWPVTGHCSYFTDVDCDKWKTQCYSCPKLAYYPSSWGYDNSKSNFSFKKDCFKKPNNLNIIAISGWSAELIKYSFLGESVIHKIPNGVNSKLFRITLPNEEVLRSKFKLDKSKILIALATTWGKRKGYFDYLALSKLLPEDFKIVLVGLNGNLAQELPQNIVAIPRTDNQEELVQLYNLAEVNLNLSYQETFGLTTVEALMCGLPSIVYNVTASPELVTEATGVVVEPGDLNGVVDAVIKIMNVGGKKYYSETCRKHALQNFDERAVYRKHLELYEKAL